MDVNGEREDKKACSAWKVVDKTVINYSLVAGFEPFDWLFLADEGNWLFHCLKGLKILERQTVVARQVQRKCTFDR